MSNSLDTVNVEVHMWEQKVLEVTPDLAADWLDKHNNGNRPIRPSVVKKYVAMMKAGQWRLSPDGIIFGDGGRLIQGQHRLTAIVRSGVTCEMLVTRGVSDDLFKVLDRGAGRTVADVLGVNKRLAEVARLAAVFKYRNTYGRPITDFDVEEMVALFGEVYDTLMECCSSTAKIFSSAPFKLAACLRLLFANDAEKDYILSTYRGLVLGKIGELSPIAQSLAGRIVAGRMPAGNGGRLQMESFALAWNVFNMEKSNNQRLIIRDYTNDVTEASVILSEI